MDDSAQKQNNLAGNATEPASDQNQVTPSGSSLNKEVGSVSDYVSHSEQAPKIDTEVKEAGVEAVSETPQLTQAHEQIGVKLSPESSKPNLEASAGQTMPMSQTKAQQVVKTNKNIRDSILWFAILMLKNFKKMGRGLSGQNTKQQSLK
jgi:hypothetical protein